MSPTVLLVFLGQSGYQSASVADTDHVLVSPSPLSKSKLKTVFVKDIPLNYKRYCIFCFSVFVLPNYFHISTYRNLRRLERLPNIWCETTKD